MAERRVVFGCGSQARYVIDNLRSRSAPDPDGLVDLEAGTAVGSVINGVGVRWNRERALAELDPATTEVLIAHGKNALKRELAALLSARGFRFFSAVHERASVSLDAAIGEGCIVNAGAVLLPNAELKAHVIVHSGAVIEHDCVLGACANVAPGVHLAGRVRVGDEAYVYTGAAVIPGVSIGARAVVGAGAVVLRDVPADARVAGNPARTLVRRDAS
jgi:sugar O-acyltransferase (sialic acid O-acetyltransferase NeuD family)